MVHKSNNRTEAALRSRVPLPCVSPAKPVATALLVPGLSVHSPYVRVPVSQPRRRQIVDTLLHLALSFKLPAVLPRQYIQSPSFFPISFLLQR